MEANRGVAISDVIKAGCAVLILGFGLEVMIPEGLTEEANRGVPTISDLIKG